MYTHIDSSRSSISLYYIYNTLTALNSNRNEDKLNKWNTARAPNIKHDFPQVKDDSYINDIPK